MVDAAQQCGLTGARRPNEAGNRTAWNFQVDALEDLETAEVLPNLLRLNHQIFGSHLLRILSVEVLFVLIDNASICKRHTFGVGKRGQLAGGELTGSAAGEVALKVELSDHQN